MRIALFGDVGIAPISAFYDSLDGNCDLMTFATKASSIDWSQYDLVIANGEREPALYVKNQCERLGIKFLLFDLGYIGRPDYWQIGRHLNWLPEFHGFDRLKKLNLDLQEYRNEGDYILIAGQKADDASHHLGQMELERIYNSWISELREKQDSPILFRKHPKQPEMVVDCEYDDQTLDESLSRAIRLLSWNSTTATDAIIAGVPIWNGIDSAQSQPLSSSSKLISRIPTEAERYRHLARVSYSQWTLEEIESSECLTTILEQLL